MGWRFAWAVLSCAIATGVACGGRTDLGETSEDGGGLDASIDAKPKKDGSADVVTKPDVYQPLGKKCSPPTSPAPPAWTPDDAGAPVHPPYIAQSGGPAITDPAFVAITFDGDELRDSVEDFVGSVGCTDYWRSIVRDYGVNDGYMIGTGHLTEKAPETIDDAQIGAFIRAKIQNNALPQPVANQTLYVIFYPDTTDITLQGEHSCQGFGGYHNEVKVSQTLSIPYAVIPNCGSFGQLSGLDAITYATSHELAEAVSDQLPMSAPAYQLPEPDDIAWAFGGGGEIGDMCEFNDDAPLFPGSFPFTVQKQWVNHQAWAFHDPCQPSTQTYFAAAPVLPDLIDYDIGLGAAQTKGIKIGVGQQKAISVKLLADGPMGSDVIVDAQDASFFFGGKTTLTFNISPKQAKIGDTIQLTVHRIGTNQQFGLEPFIITAHSQGIARTWWALVGDP